MSKGNVYSLLVDRIAALMAGMPKQEAKNLASILTRIIDATIAGNYSLDIAASMLPVAFEGAILRALPVHMMNAATLSVPWNAFHQAHGGTAYEPQSLEFVCSVPAAVEMLMRESSINTGIWPGSILDCMANALASARREVIIISPYWSILGVETLFRRLPGSALGGVNLVILTLPESHHKQEGRDALRYFKLRAENCGAACDIRSFAILGDWTPLLHAKALVADSTYGYMGSANLTGNGMDSSIEIGIAFTGVKANELRQWLYALSRHLVAW